MAAKALWLRMCVAIHSRGTLPAHHVKLLCCCEIQIDGKSYTLKRYAPKPPNGALMHIKRKHQVAQRYMRQMNARIARLA
jgi:hypothetical protein